MKRNTGKHVDVSRLFIYYNARLKNPGHPQALKDDGTNLEGAIKALEQYGCCSEAIWRYYPSSVNRKPSFESYKKAAKYCVTSVRQVPANLTAMKSCLADGHPFVFALRLLQSFHRAEKNKGRVPMPKPGEQPSSHHRLHAMVTVGYSDRSKCFIVRNSWGKEWVRGRYLLWKNDLYPIDFVLRVMKVTVTFLMHICRIDIFLEICL